MKLFDLLHVVLPALQPNDCKIHLASWNGRDDPLDIFLAGQFSAWQNWQNRKNFERPFIVSLIRFDAPSRWLFAGVFTAHGCTLVEAQLDDPWSKTREYYSTSKSEVVKPAVRYATKALAAFSSLTGRLIVQFSRPGRRSNLRAEKWTATMHVHEIRPQRLTVEDFPGYANLIVSKTNLDTIIYQQVPSWKSTLSSVAGVYLITDTKTGRHYVGSAYGAGGFWKRWSDYSTTGHGHNQELKQLLATKGNGYSSNFQFSILEIADTHASKDDVIVREKHWKDALCCRRSHGGYNAN